MDCFHNNIFTVQVYVYKYYIINKICMKKTWVLKKKAGRQSKKCTVSRNKIFWEIGGCLKGRFFIIFIISIQQVFLRVGSNWQIAWNCSVTTSGIHALFFQMFLFKFNFRRAIILLNAHLKWVSVILLNNLQY